MSVKSSTAAKSGVTYVGSLTISKPYTREYFKLIDCFSPSPNSAGISRDKSALSVTSDGNNLSFN